MEKRKPKMVICCKAGQRDCEGCIHSEPHENVRDIFPDLPCTKWGECDDQHGNTIKVRCVRVEEGR